MSENKEYDKRFDRSEQGRKALNFGRREKCCPAVLRPLRNRRENTK